MLKISQPVRLTLMGQVGKNSLHWLQKLRREYSFCVVLTNILQLCCHITQGFFCQLLCKTKGEGKKREGKGSESQISNSSLSLPNHKDSSYTSQQSAMDQNCPPPHGKYALSDACICCYNPGCSGAHRLAQRETQNVFAAENSEARAAECHFQAAISPLLLYFHQ